MAFIGKIQTAFSRTPGMLRYRQVSLSLKCRSVYISSPLVNESNAVLINWTNQASDLDRQYDWSRFHYAWLRHNCRCSNCYSSTLGLRMASHAIPIDRKPTSLTTNKSSNSLEIVWEDGHKSSFSADWLVKNTYEHNEIDCPKKGPYSLLGFPDRTIEPVVWSNQLKMPSVDYGELMESDHLYMEWSNNLERYGFCFVENSPLDETAQRNLMNRVALLRNTYWEDFYTFGNVHQDDLRGHSDVAYQSEAIEMHSDGTYFDEIPGVQMLHVVEFEGKKSAENYLIDGIKVVEAIKNNHPDYFRILSSVPLPARYVDGFMNYYSSYIPILLDAETGSLVRFHFSNRRLDVFDHKTMSALKKLQASMPDLYEAMRVLTDCVYDTNISSRFSFDLMPGRVLFTDNYRMLHGRSAYEGKRVLRGCYTSMMDWRAILRVTKERLNFSQ